MSEVQAMVRSIRLVATKDLLVEWRSRVVLLQIAPFAMVVLMIFAFALDAKAVRFDATSAGPERSVGLLPLVAPGLVWLVVLFALILMVQRSFAVEAEDGAADALRMAGMRPAAIYWGKTLALAIELFALIAVVMVLGLVMYQTSMPLSGLGLLAVTVVLATVALAIVGTLYGGFTLRSSGAALLPLLVFPATAPVVIAATRATESAFGTDGVALAQGWAWIGLLAVYTVVLGAGSSLAFGPLTEESM